MWNKPVILCTDRLDVHIARTSWGSTSLSDCQHLPHLRSHNGREELVIFALSKDACYAKCSFRSAKIPKERASSASVTGIMNVTETLGFERISGEFS